MFVVAAVPLVAVLLVLVLLLSGFAALLKEVLLLVLVLPVCCSAEGGAAPGAGALLSGFALLRLASFSYCFFKECPLARLSQCWHKCRLDQQDQESTQ